MTTIEGRLQAYGTYESSKIKYFKTKIEDYIRSHNIGSDIGDDELQPGYFKTEVLFESTADAVEALIPKLQVMISEVFDVDMPFTIAPSTKILTSSVIRKTKRLPMEEGLLQEAFSSDVEVEKELLPDDSASQLGSSLSALRGLFKGFSRSRLALATGKVQPLQIEVHHEERRAIINLSLVAKWEDALCQISADSRLNLHSKATKLYTVTGVEVKSLGELKDQSIYHVITELDSTPAPGASVDPERQEVKDAIKKVEQDIDALEARMKPLEEKELDGSINDRQQKALDALRDKEKQLREKEIALINKM